MNQKDEVMCLDMEEGFDTENGSNAKGKDAYDIFNENVNRYPPLTKEKNESLLREYHSASEEEKSAIMDQLVEGNLKLVVKEANRIGAMFKYENRPINHGLLLDFIQEGSEGLIRAVEKFDLSKGFAFSTFASTYIKTSILTFINNEYRMIRIPKQISDKNRRIREVENRLHDRLHRNPTSEEIAAELQDGSTAEDVDNIKIIVSSGNVVSMDQKRSDEEGEDNLYREIPANEQNPQEYAEAKELEERFEKAMELLSVEERFVLTHLYPQDESKPWTLQEIGQKLHRSAEGIRQISNKAKLKLIKAMK